jgi:hypothetical protein
MCCFFYILSTAMRHVLIGLLCMGALPALAQKTTLGIRSGLTYNYNFLAQHSYDAKHWGWNAELAFRQQVHPRLVLEGGLGYHSYRASALQNTFPAISPEDRKIRVLMLSIPVSMQMRIGPAQKLRFFAGLTFMTIIGSVTEDYDNSNGIRITQSQSRRRFLPGLSQTTTYQISPRLEGQFVFRVLRSFGTKDRGFLSIPEDPQTLLGMQLGLAYRFH